MRKTILLKSRYGETHKLERIGGIDSHLFLFIPQDGSCRLGFNGKEEESYDFVDPSGGPFIQAGRKLNYINKVVKSITKSKDGIVIEFE